MSEKVSIIMPVHNGKLYLHEAVGSVLQQTWSDWELIAVDDGSTDGSASIVQSYQDERIHLIQQEHRGVSAARNKGLEKAQGDFLLFLDADDVLFPRSLESRLEKFGEDDGLAFVDGEVWITGGDIEELRERWAPSFRGEPLDRLLRLSETCFVTVSWMIRVDPGRTYRFEEDMTHAEDLMFFISIADQGRYGFVEEPVLYFRRTGRSAMSDLKGLERGYQSLYRKVKEKVRPYSFQLAILRKKLRRILFRSYLKKGVLGRGLRVLLYFPS
ncbi:MAG: glycosyltransferase family 2 protein [Flavobacteriales bacterium]